MQADGQRPPYSAQAFAHGEDAQSRSGVDHGGTETRAIVSDGQPDALRGPAQGHPRLVRMGMLHNVCEGRFRDAIQSCRGLPGQPRGDSAVDKVDGNAMLAGKFRAVFAQRHRQAKVLQHRRIQGAGQILKVLTQSGYTLLESHRLFCADGHVRRL
jgi:hypothetical protein